jgi:DNA-binding CsgD family transcriptional regulator
MDDAILLFARARVGLAERDPAAALADAAGAGAHLREGFGIDHPGLVPWRDPATRAALALGDRDQARALAADGLALARSHPVPRPLGGALRTAAAVARGTRRLELLGEAVAVLEASPSQLERAHALVELGSCLREAGRREDAQSALRKALQLADGMGAVPLAETARMELRATGARPRRAAFSGADALTPAEHRVAQLAAHGLTNREIAQELFITPKTVQTHLAHAYRKLDISSRRQLSSALGGGKAQGGRA